MTGDQDGVGLRLGDAGGDGADAGRGHQLHADPRLRVDLLEVVDELGEVLDRVDVVARRRRDQADAGGDGKSVVEGKSVSVRGDLGGRRIIKKKKRTN